MRRKSLFSVILEFFHPLSPNLSVSSFMFLRTVTDFHLFTPGSLLQLTPESLTLKVFSLQKALILIACAICILIFNVCHNLIPLYLLDFIYQYFQYVPSLQQYLLLTSRIQGTVLPGGGCRIKLLSFIFTSLWS